MDVKEPYESLLSIVSCSSHHYPSSVVSFHGHVFPHLEILPALHTLLSPYPTAVCCSLVEAVIVLKDGTVFGEWCHECGTLMDGLGL